MIEIKEFFETVEKEFTNFDYMNKSFNENNNFIKMKIKEGITKTIKDCRMKILNMSQYNKIYGKVCRILQEQLEEPENL